MNREKKRAKKEADRRLSTRQFIGAKEVTDYSLVTYEHWGTGVFYCEANQYLSAFRNQYRCQDLCPDDGTQRCGRD